jgi:hypothetical protein
VTQALLQDAAVTLFALAAAGMILRRGLALLAPRRQGSVGCASCPARQSACTKSAGQPSPRRSC